VKTLTLKLSEACTQVLAMHYDKGVPLRSTDAPVGVHQDDAYHARRTLKKLGYIHALPDGYKITDAGRKAIEEYRAS